MKREILPGLCAAAFLSLPWNDLPARLRSEPLAFESLRMHLEVDLPPAPSGFQQRPLPLLKLPAEVSLEVEAPCGLARIELMDSLKKQVLQLGFPENKVLGVSELSLEITGDTLGDALREYPPGDYHVVATTFDGARIEGVARLSAQFPGMFAVISPLPGEIISSSDVKIDWTPASGAKYYVLEVEQDELGFLFEKRIPAWQTGFTVPAQVLEPGEAYEYSLLVKGDTDNELEVEGSFVMAR
jgi:hypothetical protein